MQPSSQLRSESEQGAYSLGSVNVEDRLASLEFAIRDIAAVQRQLLSQQQRMMAFITSNAAAGASGTAGGKSGGTGTSSARATRQSLARIGTVHQMCHVGSSNAAQLEGGLAASRSSFAGQGMLQRPSGSAKAAAPSSSSSAAKRTLVAEPIPHAFSEDDDDSPVSSFGPHMPNGVVIPPAGVLAVDQPPAGQLVSSMRASDAKRARRSVVVLDPPTAAADDEEQGEGVGSAAATNTVVDENRKNHGDVPHLAIIEASASFESGLPAVIGHGGFVARGTGARVAAAASHVNDFSISGSSTASDFRSHTHSQVLVPVRRSVSSEAGGFRRHNWTASRASIARGAVAGGFGAADVASVTDGNIVSFLPSDFVLQNSRLACPELGADNAMAGSAGAFSDVTQNEDPFADLASMSPPPLQRSKRLEPDEGGMFAASDNDGRHPADDPDADAGDGASTATRHRVKDARLTGATVPRKRIAVDENYNQSIVAALKKSWAAESIGSEGTAATVIDVIYCLMSTVVIYLSLSTFADFEGDDVPWGAAVIAVDVIVSVFTVAFAAVKMRTRLRKDTWDVEDDLERLRSRYLRSAWAYCDLLTILPLEFVFITWHSLAFAICLTRHLLRLPRMATLLRPSNPLLNSRRWFPVIFVCTCAVVVTQVAAIVFHHFDPTRPSYLDSVYWVVTVLSSVGFGDVVPTSPAMKYVAMATEISGILLVATFTSLGTQFLTTKDPISEEFERRKQMMYAMLKFYDVPWTVQREIIALFPAVLASQNEESFREMVGGLPEAIAHKIDIFLRLKLIANVPLFRDLHNKSLLIEIALVLTSATYQPFDYIVVVGEMGNEMFFINSGSVDVLVPVGEDAEKVVAVLRAGQWFGEMALLRQTVRTASVQASELCDILILSKNDFDDIVGRYDDLRVALEREAALRQALIDQTKRANEERARLQSLNHVSPSGSANPDPNTANGAQTSPKLDDATARRASLLDKSSLRTKSIVPIDDAPQLLQESGEPSRNPLLADLGLSLQKSAS